MIVSLLITPYAWFTDEVVLLPAILQTAVSIHGKRATSRPLGMVFALLNGLLILFIAFKVPMASGMYFWSSLLWLSVYIYGRTQASPAGQHQSRVIAAGCQLEKSV